MALDNTCVEMLAWFMDICRSYSSGFFKTVDAWSPARKALPTDTNSIPFCGIEPLTESEDYGGTCPMRDITITFYVIGTYGSTRTEKTALTQMESFVNYLRTVKFPFGGRLKKDSIVYSAEYLLFRNAVESFSKTMWASFVIFKAIGVPITQNP